jgi:outer membrane receptor for ferrienterochelin and colicins
MLPVPGSSLRGSEKVIMRAGLFILFFSGALQVVAQLKGRVVEIAPLGDTLAFPGVSVYWEGTVIGVQSDSSGRFTLPEPQGKPRLIVKALGYSDQAVGISDYSFPLVLVMKSNSTLKEVEVIQYTSGNQVLMLTPQKIEILSERSLMKAACCNLSESFETNPGIDVNFTDAVSGTKQIQMLGLSGQYAQITKENMPYLRGLASNYGLTFIPGTWIQSIQLSKGAGSVVNGYESFTGQINTELQNPEKSDRLQFNAYGNQNGRNEYNLNLSRDFNKHFAAGLLSHVSFNPLAEDLNKDGFADIPTGRQYNFINKYSVMGEKGFEGQFGGGYLLDERKGGQIRGAYPDSLTGYVTSIQNEKREIYSKTGYIFRKLPGTSTGLQLSFLDHSQNNQYGLNAYKGRQKTFYANWIFQGIFGNTNHSYKTGLSYMDDQVNENFNEHAYDRHERVPGAFFEYAYNRGNKLNVVAGIRADDHNYYGLFFTPRLHLRYAFTESSVLRFSGGSALRTPSAFMDNSSFMVSSRKWNIEKSDASLPYGLNAERGWNYGVNFTQKFKINYREAYITIDLYRTEFTQQAVVDADQDPQQLIIHNLKGPSYTNSAQFEFNAEPRKRLFVKLAYRLTDNHVTYNKGLLLRPLVSIHRGFINFSYETRNRHWQFDFTTQYNGYKRIPYTASNDEPYRRPAFSPDFYNLLGQITWLQKISSADFNLYLGVENLLNYKQSNPVIQAGEPFGKFFDASLVWGPVYGRMFYAGLRLKFK